jgi:hypothetical protein
VGGSLAKSRSPIFRILAYYLTDVAAGVAGLLDVTAGFWVKPPASFPLLFIVVSVRMPVFPSLLAFDPAVAEGNGAFDVDCPVFAEVAGCALGLPADVAAFWVTVLDSFVPLFIAEFVCIRGLLVPVAVLLAGGTSFLLALAKDAGAFDIGWPFTVRPACDSAAAFLSPIPFTRFSKSAQSLNAPWAFRSSTIVWEIFGPIPLMLSSAAWSPLLASTCAKAAVAAMNKHDKRRQYFLKHDLLHENEDTLKNWKTNINVDRLLTLPSFCQFSNHEISSVYEGKLTGLFRRGKTGFLPYRNASKANFLGGTFGRLSAESSISTVQRGFPALVATSNRPVAHQLHLCHR